MKLESVKKHEESKHTKMQRQHNAPVLGHTVLRWNSIDDDTTVLGFDYSKILVKSNPNTPAQSPATIQGIPSWTYQSIEQKIKLKLEQLGKPLNTMAKLHHNREFMEMAMARNLPPRGMQLDLNCTLLNKTQTVEEQWDQTQWKASNDLVKLAHDHYTNQVEVELKHQKKPLQRNKRANQPSQPNQGRKHQSHRPGQKDNGETPIRNCQFSGLTGG